MTRDVDKLEDLQDDQIRKQDQEYLAKHGINALLGGVMEDLLKLKPQDPLQFIIDYIDLGPTCATQHYQTGLPLHRQDKLENVFHLIDKAATGKISLRTLQEYTNKYGGETLTLGDLTALFRDFKPTNELYIAMPEFLLFFSKVSRTITNRDFEAMIADMSA